MVGKIAWTLVLFAGVIIIVEEGFWAASLGMWPLLLPLTLFAAGIAVAGLKGIWEK